MSLYLDTNVALWLAGGKLEKISSAAKKELQRQVQLLISPIVLLELAFLNEVGKIRIPGRDILLKLEAEIEVKVCDLAFSSVATAALYENWTRDPFDRLIVAHAKAKGLAPLVSADEKIREHYPRAIW